MALSQSYKCEVPSKSQEPLTAMVGALDMGVFYRPAVVAWYPVGRRDMEVSDVVPQYQARSV